MMTSHRLTEVGHNAESGMAWPAAENLPSAVGLPLVSWRGGHIVNPSG
jgi:hypothetical protein